MDQLLLDITPHWWPTFDNFVVGGNQELLYALHQALAGDGSERCLYLWGKAGSGKTHLLQAAAIAATHQSAVYAHAAVPQPAEIVIVDDVDWLDDAAQIELFNLYNLMRETGGMLLVSGAQSPLHLDLRPDLRTRLGWGLVYQVRGLSDEEKAQALAQHAKSRGFLLAPEIAHYLLRHGRRDLPSLLAVLDALDEHSLRLHRAPSVPLLKEVIYNQLDSRRSLPSNGVVEGGNDEQK
jgi:DnaA family protein